MKLQKLIITSFILLFILSSITLAVRVGPSKEEVDYNPGNTVEASFDVFDNEIVDVALSGELAPYATLTTPIPLKDCHKTNCRLTVQINTPDFKESYGSKELTIDYTGKNANSGGGGVSATAGVRTRVIMMVPYPGKYLSASVKVSKPLIKLGEANSFEITANHLGSETIEEISGKVLVSAVDWEGEIFEIDLPKITNLAPKTDKSVLVSWTAQNIETGNYKVQADLIYDGKPAERTQNRYFKVGEILVTPESLDTDFLIAGMIQKVNVVVKNHWGEQLETSVRLELKDSTGNVVAKSETQKIKVERHKDSTVQGFLDLTEVLAGKYFLTATTILGEDERSKTFDIMVKEQTEVSQAEIQKAAPPPQEASILPWIIASVAVLALVVLIIFMFFRRKNDIVNLGDDF